MKFKRILYFLHQIDCFGASYQFSVSDQYEFHTSKIGGFYTIILFLGTMIYTIIQLQQWFCNAKNPLVTQFLRNQGDILSSPFYEDLIQIKLYTEQNFTKNIVYFIPYIYQWKGEKLNNKSFPLTKQNCTEGGLYCLRLNDIQKFQLYQHLSCPSEDLTYSIFMFKCNDELLAKDEVCANDEEMSIFLKGLNYIGIQLTLKQFDRQKNNLVSYVQEFYIYLDNDFYVASNVNFKQEYVQYDNGYPILSNSKYTFLSDAEYYQQIITQELSLGKNKSCRPAFAEIYLQFDQLQIDTNIVEQNLIELFIIIFSFFRMGNSIGFILKYRSIKQLQKKLIDKFEPQFLTLQEKRFREVANIKYLLNLMNNCIKINEIATKIEYLENILLERGKYGEVKQELIEYHLNNQEYANYSFTQNQNQNNSLNSDPSEINANIQFFMRNQQLF